MKSNKFTNKKGKTFNSLADLRWAVYFDEVGIEYEYSEPDYHFYLPEIKMWTEIIPKSQLGQEFTGLRKKEPVIGIIGTPDLRPYPVINNGESTVDHFNLVPIGSPDKPEFPKNAFLKSELDYFTLGSAGISAVKAVEIAQEEYNHSLEDLVYRDQHYGSLHEYGWARYFDEMGIKYTQKTAARRLLDGTFIWPTFHLAEYDIWVFVTKKMLDAFEHECAKRLCIEQQKPILILDGLVTERHYSMMVPEEDGYYDIEITNVIPRDGKFLTGRFLSGKKAFENYGEPGKKAVKVIDNIRRDYMDLGLRFFQ